MHSREQRRHPVQLPTTTLPKQGLEMTEIIRMEVARRRSRRRRRARTRAESSGRGTTRSGYATVAPHRASSPQKAVASETLASAVTTCENISRRGDEKILPLSVENVLCGQSMERVMLVGSADLCQATPQRLREKTVARSWC